METKQLKQIEGWFRKMNERFDDTNRKLEDNFKAILRELEMTVSELERRLAH